MKFMTDRQREGQRPVPRRRLVLEPRGWPCALEDCPPGLFVATGGDNSVGVRPKFRDGGGPDALKALDGAPWPQDCNGGLLNPRLLVQSVVARWVDDED